MKLFFQNFKMCQECEKNSTFECLPPEIVVDIMELLAHVDKKKSRLVCRRWCRILDNLCNKSLTFRPTLTNISFDHFFKSKQNMDRVVIRGLTKSITKNYFPNMREVIIGDKNSRATICNIFKYGLNYTKSLNLKQFSVNSVYKSSTLSGILKEFKWNNLVELKLSVRTASQFHTYKTLFKHLRIPNLKDFSIRLKDNNNSTSEHIDQQLVQVQHFFKLMYVFIKCHANSLRSLLYDFDGYDSTEDGYDSTEFYRYDSREFDIPRIPDTKHEIMKIETFTLIWPFTPGFDVRVKGLDTLVSPSMIGTNLKNLTITTNNGFDIDIGLRQIFVLHSKTLERVRFIDSDVNLSWLKSCISLKSLSLFGCHLTLPTAIEGYLILPCLKILELGDIFDEYGSKELIIQTGKSIEHLELFNGRDSDFNLGCLSSCYALKYLNCGITQNSYLPFTPDFHNLIEWKIRTYGIRKLDDIHNWSVHKMPNLKTLYFYHFQITPSNLTYLFNLVKSLEKIYFHSSSCENEVLIAKFCNNTPGLHFTKKKNIHSRPKDTIFLIRNDRTKYAME